MAASTRADQHQVEAFTAGLDDFLRALRTARGRFNRAPALPELTAPQFHLLAPRVARSSGTSLSRLSRPRGPNPGPLPMCARADAAAVAPPTASRMLDGL